MNKKNILLFLMIFLSFLAISVCVEATKNKITFFVFGHTYPDFDALNKSIQFVVSEKPDFIIFLGDVIEDESDWEKFNSIIKDIEIPIHIAPGNHDSIVLEKHNYQLYKKFNFNDKTFVVLNTINKKRDYDISSEQVDFIKNLYQTDEIKKIIFMHNCLFYKTDEFCNSLANPLTPMDKKNNWNSKIVPIISKDTLGVFVGDSGSGEPFFAYKENEINYFGVGFSNKFPAYFLKATIEENQIKVIPISLEPNLDKINYSFIEEENLYVKIKTSIKMLLIKNLKLFGVIFIIVIILLLIYITKFHKLKLRLKIDSMLRLNKKRS